MRVALYKDQNEILSIIFNGTNSDNENWFSKDRILDSPWNDITSPTYFSIAGKSNRRFYISGPHSGCGIDYGWLSIIMQHCVYEKRFPITTVMYSKLQTKADWNMYGERIGHFRVRLFLCFKTSLRAKPFKWKRISLTGPFSCKSNSFSFEWFRA